jgi:hypothetical protein
MSSTYIIETQKGAAGIVVRDGRGFRFFAAQRAFNSLDRHLFATPRAAEAAARDCVCGANRTRERRRAPNPIARLDPFHPPTL